MKIFATSFLFVVLYFFSFNNLVQAQTEEALMDRIAILEEKLKNKTTDYKTLMEIVKLKELRIRVVEAKNFDIEQKVRELNKLAEKAILTQEQNEELKKKNNILEKNYAQLNNDYEFLKRQNKRLEVINEGQKTVNKQQQYKIDSLDQVIREKDAVQDATLKLASKQCTKVDLADTDNQTSAVDSETAEKSDSKRMFFKACYYTLKKDRKDTLTIQVHVWYDEYESQKVAPKDISQKRRVKKLKDLLRKTFVITPTVEDNPDLVFYEGHLFIDRKKEKIELSRREYYYEFFLKKEDGSLESIKTGSFEVVKKKE